MANTSPAELSPWFLRCSIYELIEDMQRIESEQGEQKFQSSGRKGVGGRANTWALYSDSLGIVSLPSQMGAECSLSGK